jgi:hypothetical protein
MVDINANTIAEEQQQAPPAQQNQGGEQTPEELEWNKLRGRTAKDRIRELIKERDEWKARSQVPPPVQQVVVPPVSVHNQFQTGQRLTPEQELAIENLRKFGVWTKKDQAEFERKQQMQLASRQQQVEDEVLIETEYARLEAVHSGSDGLPAFDRGLIEEHMKATGVYNPEKAYEDLYRDELFDSWAKGQSGGKSGVYSERPKSVTSQTEPLTLDGLRERLRQPDGQAWWEKNRDRLLPQVGELLK